MHVGGADPCPFRMIVSAVHTDEDVERTVAAFDAAIVRLQIEGAIY